MKGSTLIETLIYIALIGILMSGILPSAYLLMDGKDGVNDQNSALLLQNLHE